MGLADLREPATADSASEQAGEKITWAPGALSAYASVLGHDADAGFLLPLFDQSPKMVVDDSKVRHLLNDPLGFRVWPSLTPARIWIFDELLTIPDQRPNIQFVVENPDAAPPVAINGGGPPGFPGRTWNRLPIEGMGDRSRRAAVCELFENLPDDLGFNRIDAAFTVHGLARVINGSNNIIAEAQTTSRLALANTPLQTAPRFLSEVLQKQGVHGALQAHMQFADLAFRQSDQPHPGKAKLLEQARYILLVTREAIEGFGDKNLEPARPRILEHFLVAGP